MCVCQSVSTLTDELFDVLAQKIGSVVDLDDMSDKFDNQGPRSRSLSKNM